MESREAKVSVVHCGVNKRTDYHSNFSFWGEKERSIKRGKRAKAFLNPIISRRNVFSLLPVFP